MVKTRQEVLYRIVFFDVAVKMLTTHANIPRKNFSDLRFQSDLKMTKIILYRKWYFW